MTSSKTLLLCLAAVGTLCTGTRDVAAQKQPRPQSEIKVATLAPDGSTWMKTMRRIDEEVRTKTANRVGFKFYPGGVQGDEKDVIRKMRNGQIHGAAFTGFGLGAIVPEVRVLELPFMFESLDELDAVLERTDDYYRGLFDEKGYALLGWTDVGFVYLFSQTPVKSAADMPGCRWWIWSGDQLAEIFFKAFEITPIPLSAPDVLTSLQTGVVDAVYSSPLACVALQWFTRVKYMADMPITHGVSAVVVTRKSLAGVSEGDLAIVNQVMRSHLAELTAKTRAQNREAIGEIEKEGVQVVAVDEAARNDFVQRGRAAWGEGVGVLYPRELLDRVSAMVAEYRRTRAAGASD
ncbi:MAG: TRAP transporter substrate-binding protein DctP [Candidatus Krumholzibacteria bacterium]|nr:TRAP transporter substrate-binding protein DctP [Candidatus Krumholzibacteria bacterium]MDH4337825.1 TRAP transporter substrate-binding protein DctP [Candidatus Krumholzibacteria bacterium]MDH5270086.1 TRAP transporter substrate-binding protein DctP [Candidatus Krumholzibacteria bacterium]